MGFACQVEKSRVSAVQDGAGASTRRVKPKEDDVRVRELEEKLRALDDKVGQMARLLRDLWEGRWGESERQRYDRVGLGRARVEFMRADLSPDA
jgi:hypothetical protein